MEGWLLFFVLALVIAGAGFVQSSLGFGYAVTALSILPFFVDVRFANIVVSLSVLVPLAVAVWTYRSGLDWRLLAWCLSGALLGMPIGLLVFATLDADWLVRSTGLVILLIVLDSFRLREETLPRPISRLWTVAAGVASGMLVGSVGMGGPPVAAYAARQAWSAARFKAFLISFLLILAGLRACSLAATGWIDGRVLSYSLGVVPFGLAGGYLGTLASRRIDGLRIRRTAMVLLLFLSAGMILRGHPHSMPSADPPGNGSKRRTVFETAEKYRTCDLGYIRHTPDAISQ